MPNDVRFTILRRDGFRCRYCGEPGGAHPQGEGRTLMVDHIVSLDEGGAMMDLNNCITSCRACNLGKGKRSLDLSEVPPLVDA